MTNEQDFNDIQVDIQPQKVQGSFEIKIKHTFQRVAFQLEANQHLQANMTSVLSELSQPDQCEYSKDVKNNWYQIWSLIGEQVSTKVFAGAEQIIYITLYIQEEYTTEQVINNYTQLISKNKIQAIGNYFNNIERYNYAVYSTGGVNYYQWTNFSDYLAKLNPSNYIQIIPKDSQKFQESYVDSYKLFEQEQQKVYNCSNQSWNFRFRKTNIQ
ncbi:hypothetical protein TTHERM_000209307 (macronuclear) [Tetrahymena thermophila SB210]|uniref:Uncharacterized protein n=1 Tax=Tetrahymena thermophila (strain SB210) TaxID=312017 RepID=W7XKM8_TETTS|nr:hypothetical protein TTHERM_000209307 [Tetrahymena thermophila SB210]EWS76661.1 hypothetical protein TTHERM_000209307 [Tetrahymena thermophila SB210]|eukprot:XP_012650829.1 hypothetical protein TTHERM_000209307 [Tetrahymena thermophila SB210]